PAPTDPPIRPSRPRRRPPTPPTPTPLGTAPTPPTGSDATPSPVQKPAAPGNHRASGRSTRAPPTAGSHAATHPRSLRPRHRTHTNTTATTPPPAPTADRHAVRPAAESRCGGWSPHPLGR